MLVPIFTLYPVLGLLAITPRTSHCLPTVISSKLHPGVKVTYQRTVLCEIHPSVRSYSGYITIPANADSSSQPYEADLFFWFFESRANPHTAPLTLWLQGGPGLSTTPQVVAGHNGPCTVRPTFTKPHSREGAGFNVAANPWSWNAISNMLYIDQPVFSGFSYDGQIRRGVMDMLTGDVDVSDGGAARLTNMTVRPGSFGSQNPGRTANTSTLATTAISHFLELWFREFQQYKRDNINIWSQSYGGHYVPDIATRLIKKHNCSGKHGGFRPFTVGVDSVGIISGSIDLLVQTPAYPEFAVNNTYGIKAYDDGVAAQATADMTSPGGCADQGRLCQQLQEEYDPCGFGSNVTINSICLAAFETCWDKVYGPYEALSGRNPFDIGHFLPDPFPPPYAVGYLNTLGVQQQLGAHVNLTEPSNLVANLFVSTGDFQRSHLQEVATLLDAGVKVALIHGDRDYQCNWMGGEAVSLAVPYSRSKGFKSAGYAKITTSGGHTRGVVRQHGIFSFSIVYQAGHEVPYYQPETAFTIFARTLSGRDVATGVKEVNPRGSSYGGRIYSTTGPATANELLVAVDFPPPQPQPECYVDAAALLARCSAEQVAALLNGSAVVKNGFVVNPAS
ncbi:hypothetical protein VTK73DRAFT_5313 [Phialemonium thermophilum]|uniref:Carboxypeptidase S1 n=1 Tax=Phialemonium thermophilum TaxID=223376 RepID=A0ABR3Y7B8_9PEZI